MPRTIIFSVLGIALMGGCSSQADESPGRAPSSWSDTPGGSIAPGLGFPTGTPAASSTGSTSGSGAETGGGSPAGARPPTTDPPPPSPPPPGSCDASFLGPFCTDTACDANGNCQVTGKNPRILGFNVPAPTNPTIDQIREYSLAAVNHIRAMTCTAPLVLDACLNDIAEDALAAQSGHGYFIQHCMNAATQYGRKCECHWAQENIGASFGSGRTWVDGVHGPLCRMMTEPKNTGHRKNIEQKNWVRLGVGIRATSNGAEWYHEFGCDPSLASCPK